MAETPKITINTVQRTVYVERMDVQEYAYGLGEPIYAYDVDNLYPDKIVSIAQRSGSASTALETKREFLTGQGFTENGELVVNEHGQTLNHLLFDAAQQFATFGVPVHVKYNAMGEKVAMEVLRWEQVRVGIDGNYYIRKTWDRSKYYMRGNQTKIVRPYNPENVTAEIAEDGFENYTGQLLYFHRDRASIYPLAEIDSVTDDAQFEAEAKIFALSNIQNEFSPSGIFKYPKTMESNEEGKAVVQQVKGGSGSSNRGKTLTVGMSSNDIREANSFKMWEPMTHENIDTFYKNLREDSKRNIYEKFKQPGIINGRSDSGMFNAQSMQDAFDFYNSVTANDRKMLEGVFNELLPELAPFEIVPLTFIKESQTNTQQND